MDRSREFSLEIIVLYAEEIFLSSNKSWSRPRAYLSDGLVADSENLVMPELDFGWCSHVRIGLEIDISLRFSMRLSNSSCRKVREV